MMGPRWLRLAILLPVLALASCASPVGDGTRSVDRFEIKSRVPAFGGAAFEGAGIYEAISGVAHVRLHGDYVYPIDVDIVRPVDVAKSSRVMLVEVDATWGRQLGRLVNEGEPGNGFTMRRGHTLVWIGSKLNHVDARMLHDVALFLKSGQASPLADLRPDAAIAVGVGGAGQVVRGFIGQGLNAAPGGGKVFDGAMPLMAGARGQFPFTYAVTTDPVSGQTGGIFDKCQRNATCPKLMHVDSSSEFWTSKASLVAADGAGNDVPLAPGVRAYLISSTQHMADDRAVPGECRQPSNTARQSPLVRALLDQMVAWIRTGKEPPPSRYPRRSDSMLTAPHRDAVGFPDLRAVGVGFPPALNGLRGYQLFVPMTDVDGHDIAGVRLPDIEVPLATYTGWNLRRGPGAGSAELCGGTGMSVPIAPTPRAGDPRRAISQRYASRIDYAKAVAAAARSLRDQGLLLQEDVDRYIERAMRETRVP
ncbi:MAG TPA: alpha/beta hydrolase domain-containing protein [Telluria sp.]